MIPLAASPNGPVEFVIIGGIFVFIIIVFVVIYLAERGRKRALRESLRTMGLDVPDAPEHTASPEFSFFAGCPMLKDARNSIPWAARGDADRRRVLIFEYHYKTGHGKHTQHHRHLVIATPFRVPGLSLTVERKRWLIGHRPSVKPLALTLEDPALASNCNVYAASAEDAATLLTPELQRFLAQMDKREWVRVNDGMLMLGRRCTPRAKDIQPALDRLDRLIAALPSELRGVVGAA